MLLFEYPEHGGLQTLDNKDEESGNPAVIGLVPVRPVILRFHLSVNLPFSDFTFKKKRAL